MWIIWKEISQRNLENYNRRIKALSQDSNPKYSQKPLCEFTKLFCIKKNQKGQIYITIPTRQDLWWYMTKIKKEIGFQIIADYSFEICTIQ